MWQRRSHALVPSTILTCIQKKFKWTLVEQDAFNKIKRIVDRDNLLISPDFNETFKFYTDASMFQLGAVNIQKVKPIDLFSRKLTDSQQHYTIT